MYVIRCLILLSVIFVVCGCVTRESADASKPEHVLEKASTQAMESVSVTAEITVSTGGVLAPMSSPQTDILAGAKKPCGTIATDAPKFVEPESK